MRRIGLRVLVFLLIGAVVNVAVAWGVAFRTGSQLTRDDGLIFSSENAARLGWPVAVPEQWAPPNMYATQRSPGYMRDMAFWIGPTRVERGVSEAGIPWVNTISPRARADRVLSGWPLVALESQEYSEAGHEPPWHTVINLSSVTIRYSNWRAGLQADVGSAAPGWSIPTVLPVAPLWIRFMVDTVFWGAVGWVLLSGPGTVRRVRRIRRGLCSACGYPIGISPVCTECGKPVVARAGTKPRKTNAES